MRGRSRQVLARALATAPAVTGDPRIPALSLHGLGDLFVPFSMEQACARRFTDGAHANFSARACPVAGG
jgi:hypothetical protein